MTKLPHFLLDGATAAATTTRRERTLTPPHRASLRGLPRAAQPRSVA
jgi:hypothetical protein